MTEATHDDICKAAEYAATLGEKRAEPATHASVRETQLSLGAFRAVEYLQKQGFKIVKPSVVTDRIPYVEPMDQMYRQPKRPG